MKYKHELIGKKVLIICNSGGRSIKKIYCAYVLGEIIEINPITNKVKIKLIDTGIRYFTLYILFYCRLGTSTSFEFNLNSNDPFDINTSNLYNDIFAYKNPDVYDRTWWYTIYIEDVASKLIEKNLNEIKDKPVYHSYFLSTECYGKYRSKQEYLKYLLSEFTNEI